jgi:hypothetical protein
VDVSINVPEGDVKLEDLLYLSKQLAAAGVNGVEVSGYFRVFTEKDTSFYKKEASVFYSFFFNFVTCMCFF